MMLNVDPIMNLLSQAIDASALKHAAHTSNIANVDVDGYQRLEVAVKTTMQSDDPKALPSIDSKLVNSSESTVRLDQEMALMAQNSVRYQALLGAVEKTMSLLRYAAREGREG